MGLLPKCEQSFSLRASYVYEFAHATSVRKQAVYVYCVDTIPAVAATRRYCMKSLYCQGERIAYISLAGIVVKIASIVPFVGAPVAIGLLAIGYGAVLSLGEVM